MLTWGCVLGPAVGGAIPKSLIFPTQFLRLLCRLTPLRAVHFIQPRTISVCRDSSVGIATRYGLDCPVIGIRVGGRDFPLPGRPASYIMGTGSFPGIKRPVRGVDHPPPSSAEVKERVELYLYFLSGPPWFVLG